MATSSSRSISRVDVGEIIARRRVGRLQLEIVALCAVAMLVDGFDTAAIGYAVPDIAHDLIVPPAALSAVFTAGGIGSLVGIVAVAPLADRIGRRPVLIGALLFFAATSLFTSLASSVTQFVALRFLTGIGLGAAMPAALVLASEFMPRRYRISLTTIVWVGYSLGSGFAGTVVGSLLPDYGWPSVFVFGGLLPLFVSPLLWFGLPESLFLELRRGDRAVATVRATMIRVSRRYDSLRTVQYVTSEPEERGFSALRLFAGGRAPFTALLWLAFFMNLTAVFLVNGAIMTVLDVGGVDEDTAGTVAVVAQLGGIVGSFVAAAFAERYDRFGVLAAGFLLSALSIAALGAGSVGPVVATLVVLAAVFFTVGTQNAAIAVAAASYPTAILATAMSLALGVGRVGQIAAPLVASVRLGQHGRFALYALPALVAAAAAFAIARLARPPVAAVAPAGASKAQTESRAAATPEPRRAARRLEHLASLGLDLHGKRVLEVGAGIGEHTGFFLDRDCTVLSAEPRPENSRVLAYMLRSYDLAKAANCTHIAADIDDIDRRVAETFDIVFCYGLLDRLADPAAALALLAKRCEGVFLLETGVVPGDGDARNPPTRAWLFNQLKSLFPHVYVPRTQPAHEDYALDWTVPATGRASRAVFVASRRPIANPLLLEDLPAQQQPA